jgi:hypothetical protein
MFSLGCAPKPGNLDCPLCKNNLKRADVNQSAVAIWGLDELNKHGKVFPEFLTSEFQSDSHIARQLLSRRGIPVVVTVRDLQGLITITSKDKKFEKKVGIVVYAFEFWLHDLRKCRVVQFLKRMGLSPERWKQICDEAINAYEIDNLMRAWLPDPRSVDGGLLFPCNQSVIEMSKAVGKSRRRS